MSSNSGDTDLSSDWDIIPPSSVRYKSQTQEQQFDDGGSSSSIENSGQMESGSIQNYSRIEDLEDEAEPVMINDASSSSSDIDVIDEMLEDAVQQNTVLPPAHLAFSASREYNRVSSESPDNSSFDEDLQQKCFGTILREFFSHITTVAKLLIQNNRGKVFSILLVLISFGVKIYIQPHLTISEVTHEDDDSTEMEKLIRELQIENRNLRKQIMVDFQNEKAFSVLETQIEELKDENVKLGKMLQDIIYELQKQSEFHDKEHNMKEAKSQELYISEINKLKEQINILHFDNEELQKQLVRIRYGSSSLHHKGEQARVREREYEGKTEESKNDEVVHEIKDLPKDLYDEILKLKKWNEIFELLLKEMHVPKSASQREKEFHPEWKEKKRLWGWKDFKRSINQIMDTIPNINVSGMSDKFAKQMKDNKKQMEAILKSVGYYFKAAQEKTQKILESHTSRVKDAAVMKYDIWSMFTELSDKWSEIKSNIFKKNTPSDSRSLQTETSEGVEFENQEAKSRDRKKMSNVEKNSYQNNGYKRGKASVKNVLDKNMNAEQSDNREELQQHAGEVYQSDYNYQFNAEDRNMVDKTTSNLHGKKSRSVDEDSNSWLFARAADRAKLREMYHKDKLERNEKDSPINWFLRKRRESPDDFFVYIDHDHVDDDALKH